MEEPTSTTSSTRHGMTNGSSVNKTNPQPTKKPTDKTKPNDGSGNSRTKKTVYHWGNTEVIRWLRKYHTHYYNQYSRVFQEHDLSGRALVRLDPIRMEKMGITNSEHIADLLEHILRLRLKHEQNELKILQSTHQAAP